MIRDNFFSSVVVLFMQLLTKSKTKSLSFLFVFIFLFGYAQTTAIPDVNFEQELIAQGIDTNGQNGNILNIDAQAITTLNLGNNGIIDITGINTFINLTDLDLGTNPIINVDLSGLLQLINFRIDDTEALLTLDLTQNTLLEVIYLETNANAAFSAPITTLDLSQNVNLISIEMRWFKNLTDFILPTTTTLTHVNIRYLADATLDFSLLVGLENLQIRGSQVNTVITLPNVYTNLTYLNITSIEIPTIDISNYINLEALYFWGTYVENLLLPNSATLEDIFIILHNIQNPLDFSILPNLTDLDITSNQTTPLVVDVTQNFLLEKIDLSRNDLNTIDITQNSALEKLTLSVNNLTSIDVTQNVLLDNFQAYSNQITGVDLTQNIVLEYLILRDNLIPTLDVTQNIALRSIDLGTNLFTTTGLDLTQNVALTSLSVDSNQIESLDISQTISLRTLEVDNNLFSGTSILDQFYTIRLNDNGITGGSLIASFNQLQGTIPDFASLIEPYYNVSPIRFDLAFDNNNFEFGHFEEQHSDYVLYDNTFGPAPNWTSIPNIDDYFYAPQAKVDTIDTINANAGDNITLTTVCAGAQNHYTWFKDGVAIAGAPDSPNYTITAVNSCDIGVYYTEITSDLVPFENANTPGTDGKNLLLVRNDISLNITSPVEDCVNLTSPVAGATNVALNETLEWSANLGACGYFVSIGTTPGGTDILNNVDVGDVINYNIGTNFPASTQIYVTITPYFYSGNTLNCPEVSFTTGTTESPTTCTNLTMPINGDVNVPTTTNIDWDSASFATGYFVSIGTTIGGLDVVNMLDVGNITTYNLPTDLASGIMHYVTISPYNGLGTITGCIEESFTTENNMLTPSCTNISNPLNNETDVLITTDISWNTIMDATGYNLTVGSTSGGTDILDNFDVGNLLTYDLSTNLPNGTQIFVTVTPYNASGNSVGCAEESFVTEQTPPLCTNLTAPLNGVVDVSIATNLSWTAIGNATGYTLSVGTTSTGIDIINVQDVGNVTTFNLPADLPDETQIFVSIIPYNSVGTALGCTEESFTTEVVIPICTNLVAPLNGAVAVSIASDLSWNAIGNATGYTLTVGTTSGGTDIINAQDVGNDTTFNLPIDLPDETQIFVSIIPYNSAGNAITCIEESFTTEVVIPLCTNLMTPLSGAIDVSIASNLSWNAIGNATGYTLSVGTISGGTDIVNNQDVGNVTTFNLPTDLPDETQIFVSIIPYNSAGNALGCAEESFTTEVIIPLCTNLTLPLDGTVAVSIASDLSWNAIGNATGYTLTVGTTSGGTEIINNQDVGNVTTFNLPTDLPSLTQIFVSVVPYNSAGNAINCSEESFNTELPLPSCSNLISPVFQETNVPLDANLTWSASDYAAGYIISIGSTTGALDILTPTDVGNVTTFNPPIDLPNFTEVFVTIQAYNATGTTVCGDYQFTTQDLRPLCVGLTFPYNGQTDVAIISNISWDVDANADGYILNVGTIPGGNDIVNAIDTGNITTYNFPNNLPQNSTIYVNITSYNFLGNAIGCAEQSFTTELFVPECANLLTPLNGETNVSTTTGLSWTASDYAAGYILLVGTTSGGVDIVNVEDVGNITNYAFTQNLPDNTTFYVLVIAYNTEGNAINCNEYSFTTETVIPECTTLITPFNNQTDVLVNSTLVWNSINNAAGYTISIGTTPNGNEIINGLDVGNLTTYVPLNEFFDNTVVYVSIKPYNSAGSSLGCNTEQFVTEDRSIYTPAFFTPNGDSFNQFWKVEDPKNEIKHIAIFDRLGKLLYSFKVGSRGWDGTFNGNKLPTNDYWYVLEKTDGTAQRGHFTLKR